MQPRPPSFFGLSLVIGCGVLAAWCGGSSPASPTTPTAIPIAAEPQVPDETPVNQTPIATNPTPPPVGTTWINVFGDTGWCGSPAMPHLARLLSDLGGDILLAGDLAYDSGTIEEFRRCFDPVFGKFRSRFWAAPGNHDYATPGASGYFTYFAERAGPDRSGFYELRMNGWQVLMLNSNVPMGRGSRQLDWVRQHLQSNTARCTLAVWHHPFDSSGPNGPNPMARDMWELLYNGNADVVVSAHDHLYERQAPQDASGKPDPVRGIRHFISGAGGAPPYQRARAARNSEMLVSTHGLLRLKLEPALYEWEFLSANGAVLDRGLNICH
jgi:hypothetical protein